MRAVGGSLTLYPPKCQPAVQLCCPAWRPRKHARLPLAVGASGAHATSSTAAPLDAAHVGSYLQRHNVRGCLLEIQRDVDDPDVVKSLVFMADLQPLLVIVRGADKVDQRKLADYLRIPRRRLRMAKPEEVLLYTGFAVGTVPPIGHVAPLRTLVDKNVTQQATVYAGSGSETPKLQIDAQLLVELAHGHIADVVVDHGAASNIALKPNLGATAGATAGAAAGAAAAAAAGTAVVAPREAAAPTAAAAATAVARLASTSVMAAAEAYAALPVPWEAGSETVTLYGVVAQRRRIAKMLLFVILVPEVVPPLPPTGQAAYVRRLWRHPSYGHPCEVQLIMGKAIERQLGREATCQLLDRVRSGNVIAVTATVQPPLGSSRAAGSSTHHGASVDASHAAAPPAPIGDNGIAVTAAADYSSSRNGSSSSSRNDGSGSNGGDSAHTDGSRTSAVAPGRAAVLDVVCHQVRVLYKNKDALQRAVRRAKRAGHPHVSSAVDLDQINQVVADGAAAALDDEDAEEAEEQEKRFPGPQRSRFFNNSSTLSTTNSSGSGASSSASVPAAAVSAPMEASTGMEAFGAAVNSGALLARASTSGAPAAAARKAAPAEAAPAAHDYFHQLPLPDSAVRLVATLDDVIAMQTHVRRYVGEHQALAATGMSRPLPAVAGLDCEWQPYGKGETRQPVALLQVALRDTVFLVDMLSLCRPVQPQPPPLLVAPAAASGDISSRKSPVAASNGGRADVDGVGTSAAGATAGSADGSAAVGSMTRTAEELAVAELLTYMWRCTPLVKLGYLLAGDMQRLRDSYPWLPPADLDSGVASTSVEPVAKARSTGAASLGITAAGERLGVRRVMQEQRHWVDLEQLLRQQGRTYAASRSASHVISLSSAVQRVLGRPLDKAQQCSDWAARPLTRQQALYAANDAHCLTMIYDELFVEGSV